MAKPYDSESSSEETPSNGSIASEDERKNVAEASPDEEVDEEELEAVARTAGPDDDEAKDDNGDEDTKDEDTKSVDDDDEDEEEDEVIFGFLVATGDRSRSDRWHRRCPKFSLSALCITLQILILLGARWSLWNKLYIDTLSLILFNAFDVRSSCL